MVQEWQCVEYYGEEECLEDDEFGACCNVRGNTNEEGADMIEEAGRWWTWKRKRKRKIGKLSDSVDTDSIRCCISIYVRMHTSVRLSPSLQYDK